MKSRKKSIRITKKDQIGVVSSVVHNKCKIIYQKQMVDCHLPKKVRFSQPDGIIVGDKLTIRETPEGSFKAITVLPRETMLVHKKSLVANGDQVIVVIPQDNPFLNSGLIESVLIAAKRGGLLVHLCLTKSDLKPTNKQCDLKPYLSQLESVIEVSTHNKAGFPELKNALAGKTSILLGACGSGKTSLIQAALGNNLGISSASHHGTSNITMYADSYDMRIVDMPGLNRLASEDVSSTDLYWAFPEIAAAAEGCHFSGCSHDFEPDCQVKQKVRKGLISQTRYQAYLGFNSSKAKRDQKTFAESFSCANCGELVTISGAGSQHRNHCPHCLASLHLDNEPGDRSACCGGVMDPVSVWVRHDGEWAIIHRCRECGDLKSNRIAADDNTMLLLSLAVRPLSKPPFPLSQLQLQITPAR